MCLAVALFQGPDDPKFAPSTFALLHVTLEKHQPVDCSLYHCQLVKTKQVLIYTQFLVHQNLLYQEIASFSIYCNKIPL